MASASPNDYGLYNSGMQASFNQLKSLPAAMGHLPKLELMRVAVNSIQKVMVNSI